MTSRSRLLPPLVVFALLAGTIGCVAQTAGPDEAVKPNGAVTQTLALTSAQKDVIYKAVVLLRVKTSANIPLSVGAPVPPLAELRELPDQAAIDNPWAILLKYAMVGDEVVVVDPIEMRVVDVIRDGARP
jgi:hypothetical protein